MLRKGAGLICERDLAVRRSLVARLLALEKGSGKKIKPKTFNPRVPKPQTLRFGVSGLGSVRD